MVTFVFCLKIVVGGRNYKCYFFMVGTSIGGEDTETLPTLINFFEFFALTCGRDTKTQLSGPSCLLIPKSDLVKLSQHLIDYLKCTNNDY